MFSHELVSFKPPRSAGNGRSYPILHRKIWVLRKLLEKSDQGADEQPSEGRPLRAHGLLLSEVLSGALGR